MQLQDYELYQSLYQQEISSQVLNKAKNIKLLICDVDGVFSDGRIYLGNDGEELKAFHTRDGYGIKEIQQHGIAVAIITGRKSAIVEQRMRSLNVQHIYQGQEDKIIAYKQLLTDLELSDDQVAYIGDDLGDQPVMQLVGLSVAVNDAHPLLVNQSDFITSLPGGFGAVRELCDMLLIAQQRFNQTVTSST